LHAMQALSQLSYGPNYPGFYQTYPVNARNHLFKKIRNNISGTRQYND